MPNTSAAILKSATAISPSKHATAEHIRTATSLFETIGLVSVVEEEDMHAVTALSEVICLYLLRSGSYGRSCKKLV